MWKKHSNAWEEGFRHHKPVNIPQALPGPKGKQEFTTSFITHAQLPQIRCQCQSCTCGCVRRAGRCPGPEWMLISAAICCWCAGGPATQLRSHKIRNRYRLLVLIFTQSVISTSNSAWLGFLKTFRLFARRIVEPELNNLIGGSQ